MCDAVALCHNIHRHHCAGSVEVCKRNIGCGSGYMYPLFPLHAQADSIRESKTSVLANKNYKEQCSEGTNLFGLRNEVRLLF